MIEAGDTITFSTKLYDKDPAVDSSAALVNPSSVSLTIYVNDVSVATPTISATPTPTGVFSYKYPTTTYGRHRGRWLFTMADGSTSAYVEVFDVQPLDPGFIISLQDAKQHLNIPASKTTNDEEIRGWLAAITPVVEDYVGPVLPRTVTETVTGTNVLNLTYSPIMAIVSVTPWYQGAAYSPSMLRFDEFGNLVLAYGGPFFGGTFTVVYTVGMNPIPPNITAAVRIILKHLWETQRGTSGSPYQGEDETIPDIGMGFAVPNRAIELLQRHRLGPSVA